MKYNLRAIIMVAFITITVSSFAQNDRNWGIISSALRGLEYEVKAGLNIGGASPLPLHAEIREVNSYMLLFYFFMTI